MRNRPESHAAGGAKPKVGLAIQHNGIREQLTVSRPSETVPTNLRAVTLVVAIVDGFYADELKCGEELEVYDAAR